MLNPQLEYVVRFMSLHRVPRFLGKLLTGDGELAVGWSEP